jgi:hypothetical protein
MFSAVGAAAVDEEGCSFNRRCAGAIRALLKIASGRQDRPRPSAGQGPATVT